MKHIITRSCPRKFVDLTLLPVTTRKFRINTENEIFLIPIMVEIIANDTIFLTDIPTLVKFNYKNLKFSSRKDSI